jgi:hypothetical protein
MKGIKVGRIEIRLKGISPEVAQSSILRLGDELMRQIAKQYNLIRGKGVINISSVDGGVFQAGRDTTSSDLGQMIASKITSSIASKIMDTTKGG